MFQAAIYIHWRFPPGGRLTVWLILCRDLTLSSKGFNFYQRVDYNVKNNSAEQENNLSFPRFSHSGDTSS